MAFVADQPAESCRDRSQAQPGQSGRAALLAQPGAPPLGQLAAQLGSQAGRYRQRLGELVQVAGAGDLRSVEGTLAQFAQAEESLWDGLDQARRALLEKESLGDADLDLLATSGALKARELAVYLAVAETVMARQQGVPPQTDLRQLAQQVQLKLDEVVQAAGQTDLTLPAGTPVLRIRAVSLHAGATQPLRLDVDLENAGNAPADGVEVALLLDGALSGAPAALGTVGTGERKQATLVAPSPTGPLATVQVRSQGRLMDSYLVRVPDELLAPRAGPAAPSRSAPAAPQAPVSGPSSAALIGLAVLGVAVLGGAGVLLASRSPSGPAASQRAGSARLARGGALTIGRDPRCELALPDPKVSHRHACITGGPSGYLLADLGSRNGSWVNGQRVQQQLLRAGDVIRLGDTELIFHVDRRGRPQLAPRAASPPAPGPADRTAPGASRLGVAYLSDGVQRYPIPPAGCAIGRSPECAISLRDAYVARRHARLDWRGGAWVLTDLGSAGGTYVNGRRVRQHALRPGDEVRLGETLLRFG